MTAFDVLMTILSRVNITFSDASNFHYVNGVIDGFVVSGVLDQGEADCLHAKFVESVLPF